ncbi:MAG TPA: oligosaccharide flippase family protein [Geminicoccaceae bacterium]|nr:oligosaccharide flippase family protein [Geminicoccus sp.]HMU51630.1 oligosaccharide flippase family protein [Geminicoccaceae bacterium]
MLKHGFIYFVGRFGASAIALLSVAIYTRLLSPDAYGVYALVLSAALTAYAILAQWLVFAQSRFLPAYQGREPVVITHIAVAYGAMAAIVLAGAAAALPWLAPGETRLVLVMGVVIFLAMSPAELVLASLQMQSLAMRYVQLALLRAIATTLIGLALVFAGWGATGLLVGVVAGHLGILAICARGIRQSLRRAELRRSIMRELAVYGLPAALTSGLGAVIHASDRYIIGLLLGVEAAGLYAAPYDLTMRSLYVLMTVVAMAGNPIVMRTFEARGPAEARPLMLRQAELMLGVAMPATVGCILLAPAIAAVLLGEAFRASAAELMPWIAVGTLLAGYQTLYLAFSFSLPKKPLRETWIVGLGALLNVVLTLALVPRMGLVGAAMATVVAYAFILVASLHVGRRLLPMPTPLAGMAKIALGCAVLAAFLWPVRHITAPLPVLLHAAAGGLAYLLIIASLDVAGLRAVLARGARLASGVIRPLRPGVGP